MNKELALSPQGLSQDFATLWFFKLFSKIVPAEVPPERFFRASERVKIQTSAPRKVTGTPLAPSNRANVLAYGTWALCDDDHSSGVMKKGRMIGAVP